MCKYEILTTTRYRTTTQIPLTIEQLQLTYEYYMMEQMQKKQTLNV